VDYKFPKFKTVFEMSETTEVVFPAGGAPYVQEYSYNEDKLVVMGKGLDQIKSERFNRSYLKGMSTGHKIGRPKGSDVDVGIRFRVYVNIWAAERALELDGDFVEFGTNTGITALAICDYLDRTRFRKKKFYLFDTFCGIPAESCSSTELPIAMGKNSRFYEECFESVRATFAPYENVILVRGAVPDTLGHLESNTVSYAHIDMNVAHPECEALKHVWPKLTVGGVIVFDDYGWNGHREQRLALDLLAQQYGEAILELPTGQGLLVKGSRSSGAIESSS